MKVGIVGRTGAGKSSILQTLFRLVELEPKTGGTIKIDGLDIAEAGLHMLRKGIAFIPQLPFLLQGTIRENIDPFHESDDETIWRVLKEVNLFDHVDKMEEKMDTKVSEGSNLFSVGQK